MTAALHNIVTEIPVDTVTHLAR